MKPEAPSTVAKPSSELEYIAGMLECASNPYGLQAEVVYALCEIVRNDPDVSIAEATFQALAEWDC